MGILFLFLSAVPAFLGAWILVDFLIWLIRGRLVLGVITGFQEKKDKGSRLPVLTVEWPDGVVMELKPQRIDQISYLLGSPREGDCKKIVVQKGVSSRSLVFGYLNVLVGLLCIAPFLGLVAARFGQYLFAGQLAYISVFAVVSVGGWVVLKIIQKM